MLSVYSNNKELLKTTSTTSAKRLESVDSTLLDSKKFSVSFLEGYRPNLEMHVYTPDGAYLYGTHNAKFSIEDNVGDASLAYHYLSIDTSTELESLGITRGSYKIIYNLFDDVVGGFESQKLWIKEISPSRRELRIQLVDNSNGVLVSQAHGFRDRWSKLETDNIFNSFVLNFGFNETYQIVNAKFDLSYTDTPEIIVRLYNPLPAKFGEKTKVWISEEILEPILDTVTVVPVHVPVPTTTLAPPNFELEEFDGFSVATDFKSWNDLLSSNLSTSQQIIDSQFSGSLSGIKLNINYKNFEEFVHYSSAVERVKNFKYKLELIEYYTNRITTVSLINGGDITQNNLSDLYQSRNRVVSAFDDFEKYLFFESTGSELYSHYDSSTGSLNPWPKTTAPTLTWQDAWMAWSTAATNWSVATAPDPYGYFSIQVATDSAAGELYYADLLEKAEIYDKWNIHRLEKTIPSHIIDSGGNEEFILFVNMLAQHFDILWTYIKGLTRPNTREEHPKDGMANDLLYHVAESMGFQLLNGKSTSDLWRYALGIDSNGTALQSEVNGITPLSDEEYTKEIWRRIVNNLPYILKSKGTSRSIKALMSCFGIPSNILTIKEYGGPTTFTELDHFPEYTHDVYHYTWHSNQNTGSISVPVTQYINGQGQTVPANTLEFRFKTDSNYTYSSGSNLNIVSISSGSVSDYYNLILTKETNDDYEGTLTLFSKDGNAVSASNLQIFDDSWHLVSLENIDNVASLKVAKTLYGNKIYIHSASFNNEPLFPEFSNETITFASGSRNFSSPITLPNGNTIPTLEKFYGHYHEVRLWSGSLNDATLIEHAASPNTYTFNVDRYALSNGSEAAKPYDHLFQRYTLSDKTILSGSFYQTSVHPNQKINTGSLYYNGYLTSGSISFEGFEETYYTPSPSLGTNTLFTSKVRIESSSYNPNRRLNTKTRVENSSFDKYSVDSNRLGVYFSPQTAINEDIFNQLGYFEIDDYIGNPGDTYNSHYQDLNNFAIQYWKKYENRNDFEAYFRALSIYDFTLFKYIKRMLPSRTNAVTGLVVEPNVLERSKVRLLNKPVIEDLTKQAHIDRYQPNIFGAYQEISGSMDFATPAEATVAPDLLGSIDQIIINPSSEVLVNESTSVSMLPDLVSTAGEANAGLINNIITHNRLGEEYIEHKFIGKYKLTVTGSYTPIQTTVYNSRSSNHLTYSDEALRYSTMDSIAYEFQLTASNTFVDLAAEYEPFTKYRLVIDIESNQDSLWAIEITNGSASSSPFVQYPYTTTPSGIQTIEFTPKAGFSGVRLQNKLSVPDDITIKSVYLYKINRAQVNNFYGTGHENLKWNGSKLTGPAVNVDSPNTVDGGPVVKVTAVNPNQIVFANNQVTTINQSVTGTKNKSI